MKSSAHSGIGILAIAVIIAAIAGGGGYWFGSRKSAHGDGAETAATHTANEPGKKARKLLYYRNPMGLPDTSPAPKKDPMGMDYIPVYEDEEDHNTTTGTAGPQIKISTEKVQKLGVRTEAAQRRVVGKAVRAAGRVEPDERRTYAISPKFEGYVERLHVNVTGQPVGKGQALFEVYSPELVSAQREYAIAMQGIESLKEAGDSAQSGMRQLAESTLLRLKNWDISESQIKALAQSGKSQRTLTFRSPVSGIVTEKKALQGMRFMPGEALYQIADLSSVWIVADVFEQDIGLVRTGTKATIRIDAYPDKMFTGKVDYVYPTLNPATRTIPVRVELNNPGLLLKPAMFAQMELATAARDKVVTIPASAVIDSGTRQIALVQLGEGRFEPREVKLGMYGGDYVEVIDGIKEGESVVVAANFLIDAESNLKAAISGFSSTTPAASVSHHAEGRVENLDVQTGTITVEHGPVASLKWPAMTMEFKAANESLLRGLKPGGKVAIEFVERQPGEWVITRITPSGQGNASPGTTTSSPRSHAGH